MDTAAVGVAQKEDRQWGIDEQDIFDRVVFFLAAITVFLFSRVLGADDPPFRPVMGKRGAVTAGVTAGAITGALSSPRGVTTAVASRTVTPSRCAKAASERVGASPRERRAVRSTGSRTWSH